MRSGVIRSFRRRSRARSSALASESSRARIKSSIASASAALRFCCSYRAIRTASFSIASRMGRAPVARAIRSPGVSYRNATRPLRRSRASPMTALMGLASPGERASIVSMKFPSSNIFGRLSTTRAAVAAAGPVRSLSSDGKKSPMPARRPTSMPRFDRAPYRIVRFTGSGSELSAISFFVSSSRSFPNISLSQSFSQLNPGSPKTPDSTTMGAQNRTCSQPFSFPTPGRASSSILTGNFLNWKSRVPMGPVRRMKLGASATE